MSIFSHISYIIPFRGSNLDRIQNLKFHLFATFKILKLPLKYIIVELDTVSKIKEIIRPYPSIRHIFIKSDKYFRKSVLLNCAVKQSDTPIVILSD